MLYFILIKCIINLDQCLSNPFYPRFQLYPSSTFQRVNKSRDPDLEKEYDITERSGFLRSGHKGLITIDDTAKARADTEFRDRYTPPQVDLTRKVGKL